MGSEMCIRDRAKTSTVDQLIVLVDVGRSPAKTVRGNNEWIKSANRALKKFLTIKKIHPLTNVLKDVSLYT